MPAEARLIGSSARTQPGEHLYTHMKTEFLDLRLQDNMAMMAEFPDKHFDLAIVDPPYGIGEDGQKNHSRGNKTRATQYAPKNWDSSTPSKEYFLELERISKNQIIWGANYFSLSPAPGWIVWHKKDAATDFSDCELARCTIGTAVRYFRFLWAGMWQGDMGNKESRIHPTQKPRKLYDWLLANYAKPGQRIIDTHMGSGSIAIACHYAKCHLTACEIDPDYFHAACDRIKRETAQTDFFADIAAPAEETPMLL